MHNWISVVCGPKFTQFFSPNVKWVATVVVERVFLGFSICRSVPKIFAIKVESCQKSRRNLDVFLALPKFRGGPSKTCTHIITPASWHVVWKKFREDTPTSPEVIGGAHYEF